MTVLELTELDAKEISTWDYGNDYKIYNCPSWKIMCEEKWAMTIPDKRKKEFRKIIDKKENIIGYFRFKKENNKIIIGLGMNPQLCGQGNGHHFINKIIEFLNDKTNIIELEVRSFNKRAIRCYEKSGFKIIDKQIKNTRNGEDEFIIMQYNYKPVYYHASPYENIKILEPRISNHKKSLIYFSTKKENVLVYLSNAIEKYCKDTNFKHEGTYSTWGPYSFTNEGLLQLEEYYPNALEETYKGISGYIYSTSTIPNMKPLSEIKDVYVTDSNTTIEEVEHIVDAYEEILKYERLGLIKILRYEEFIKLKKEWLYKIIQKEYKESINQPEYRYFLKNKFPFIKI